MRYLSLYALLPETKHNWKRTMITRPTKVVIRVATSDTGHETAYSDSKLVCTYTDTTVDTCALNVHNISPSGQSTCIETAFQRFFSSSNICKSPHIGNKRLQQMQHYRWFAGPAI
jgi:hypothetical protein